MAFGHRTARLRRSPPIARARSPRRCRQSAGCVDRRSNSTPKFFHGISTSGATKALAPAARKSLARWADPQAPLTTSMSRKTSIRSYLRPGEHVCWHAAADRSAPLQNQAGRVAMRGKMRDRHLRITHHRPNLLPIGVGSLARLVRPDGIVGVQRELHAHAREALGEHLRLISSIVAPLSGALSAALTTRPRMLRAAGCADACSVSANSIATNINAGAANRTNNRDDIQWLRRARRYIR